MSKIQAQHHVLVKRESKRVLHILSLPVDTLEDLQAYGYIGLLEALKRYEPCHGIPFEYYAIPRIRGAIIDGAGTVTSFSRSAYKQLKYLSTMYHPSDINKVETYDTATQSTSEQSVSDQSASDQNISEQSASDQSASDQSASDQSASQDLYEEVDHHFSHIQQMAVMISLDTFFSPTHHHPISHYEIQIDIQKQRESLSKAFQRLSQTEQDLLIAVYDLRNCGDNAYHYAQRKDINRSSVSRMHGRVIQKLKRFIQEIGT